MKRHAPAAARNREPILAVLRGLFVEEVRVLEIASGTGEHAVAFAQALPHVTWQPSDVDPVARESIAAHRAEAGLDNLLEPLALDVAAQHWDAALPGVGAIVCINMIHIAPWGATEGLMRGAGRLLPPGGALITYGPYRFDGVFTAPSNEHFDASLRQQNPEWGVRDMVEVSRLAAASGLSRETIVEMPANNHVLVFRRTG